MLFPNDDIALGGTIAGAILAIAYKAFLRLRGDRRADAADREQDVGYREIISELRREGARMSQSIRVLSTALDDEINARRAAQDENATLKRRLTHLETELILVQAELIKIRNGGGHASQVAAD